MPKFLHAEDGTDDILGVEIKQSRAVKGEGVHGQDAHSDVRIFLYYVFDGLLNLSAVVIGVVEVFHHSVPVRHLVLWGGGFTNSHFGMVKFAGIKSSCELPEEPEASFPFMIDKKECMTPLSVRLCWMLKALIWLIVASQLPSFSESSNLLRA